MQRRPAAISLAQRVCALLRNSSATRYLCVRKAWARDPPILRELLDELGPRAGRQERTLATTVLDITALEGMVRATLARRAAQEAIGGRVPGIAAG